MMIDMAFLICMICTAGGLIAEWAVPGNSLPGVIAGAGIIGMAGCMVFAPK